MIVIDFITSHHKDHFDKIDITSLVFFPVFFSRPLQSLLHSYCFKKSCSYLNKYVIRISYVNKLFLAWDNNISHIHQQWKARLLIFHFDLSECYCLSQMKKTAVGPKFGHVWLKRTGLTLNVNIKGLIKCWVSSKLQFPGNVCVRRCLCKRVSLPFKKHCVHNNGVLV